MSTAAATFSAEVDLDQLSADFFRLTSEIGWCSVATVDGRGRPRSRILHVTWELRDDRLVGWVSTTRTPVKAAHLAGNPYASCSYWSPAHDAVFVDCRAGWVQDSADRAHVFDLVAAEAAARGFDALQVWPGGATDPAFEVLRLDPWRLQVTLQDLAHGKTVGSSRVWHAPQDNLD
jgi:hypothetical protein